MRITEADRDESKESLFTSDLDKLSNSFSVENLVTSEKHMKVKLIRGSVSPDVNG